MATLVQFEEREANIRGIMLYAKLGNVRGVHRYERRQRLAAAPTMQHHRQPQ
jgi:hypothetical protein